MRKLNNLIVRSLFAAAIILWFGTSYRLLAQTPGSLDGVEPPPSFQPPKMNVDKEIGKMAKRYALTDSQKAEIRPILLEEVKKLDAVLKDSSLDPEDRFSRMRAIQEEQVSRISAVLTENQQAKYLKDQRRMARDQEPDGPLPPPPPGEGAGAGPPPD